MLFTNLNSFDWKQKANEIVNIIAMDHFFQNEPISKEHDQDRKNIEENSSIAEKRKHLIEKVPSIKR